MLSWTKLFNKSRGGPDIRARLSVEQLNGRVLPSVAVAVLPDGPPTPVTINAPADDWEYDSIAGNLRPLSDDGPDAPVPNPSDSAANSAPSENAADPSPDDKKDEERNKRLEELSKDPDRNKGQPDDTTKRKAKVGLALEEAGKITGPIRRPDPAKGEKGDFIDGNGQAWDHKAYKSREILNKEIAKQSGKPRDPATPVKGEFDLKTAAGGVRDEIKKGEKVILDTEGLTKADRDALVKELDKEIKDGKVVLYP